MCDQNLYSPRSIHSIHSAFLYILQLRLNKFFSVQLILFQNGCSSILCIAVNLNIRVSFLSSATSWVLLVMKYRENFEKIKLGFNKAVDACLWGIGWNDCCQHDFGCSLVDRKLLMCIELWRFTLTVYFVAAYASSHTSSWVGDPAVLTN